MADRAGGWKREPSLVGRDMPTSSAMTSLLQSHIYLSILILNFFPPQQLTPNDELLARLFSVNGGTVA